MKIFKKKIKTEAFAAITAIIVSACALGVSFYEASIMRTHQKSAVWPYIQLGQQYDSKGFALEAYNKGVGPAMIESLKVWVDNKPVNSLNQVLDTLLGEGHGVNWNNYSIHNVNQNVLESGYNEPMVRFQWNDDTRILQKKIDRIKIEMIYKSIYDDCWMVSFDSTPKPCDCPSERVEKEQFSF